MEANKVTKSHKPLSDGGMAKEEFIRVGTTLYKIVGDRYPTSRYSIFSVKSVSGQICGQKFFAEEHGGGKARKREKNGDFASFRRSAHEAVTRSQSKRVTVTLHPEYQKQNCFRHNIIAEAILFVND